MTHGRITNGQGYQPFLDLPLLTGHDLELALDLKPEDEQRSILEAHGWHVVNAHVVGSTPLGL